MTGIIITPENWKEHRMPEAKRRFSIEAIVQYDKGFTRFQEEFGQVLDITKSGTVYVAKVYLETVARNKVERPADWQLGGWFDYDPKLFTRHDKEVMKFMPRFDQDFYDLAITQRDEIDHLIVWQGARGTGRYNLRPITVREDGLVRATYDGFD
jgi:hypothetical protein